jgi:alginate O-acetyltransferase complex protein AlgI
LVYCAQQLHLAKIMVFSSAIFLFYFLPLFLLGYFLLPSRLRNLYATVASLLFYAWGAPKFFFIFVGSCLADYLLAQRIAQSEMDSRRRAFLWLSTALNVGLLVYFKYSNFFVEQTALIASTLGIKLSGWHKVALPIGISFFTFHKISYVVDVWRRTSRPARNFAEYLLYITFFPQLIAGPIVRYHEIEEQIRARALSWDSITQGAWRFTLGLGSKVLIADPLASVADRIFKQHPFDLSIGYSWLGALAYSMQIYFDFAGYSSMAVGLALLVGFRFPENFNHPYMAISVTDFWRRWHISLSRWMRDYLYIPLGGNRVSPMRQTANLWIVFLVSGFWHGAEWTFIAWGAYHGFFLAGERTRVGRLYLKLPALPRRAATFVVITLGWVLFRSTTLTEALQRWSCMFGFSRDPIHFPRATIINDIGLSVLIFAVGWCLVAEPLLESFTKRHGESTAVYHRHPLVYPLIVAICLLSILVIEAGRYSPFIYFQF